MKMFDTNAKIFRYFLLCFIIGVGIASFVNVDYFWLYLMVLILGVGIGVFCQNKFWRFLFLGGIIIALGIFRYQLSLPKTDESEIWFYNEERVNFSGLVIKEADKRVNHTKLTIEVDQLKDKEVDGKVLVSVGLYPEYRYGDMVSVYCHLKSPEPFEGFAYDRYLAKSEIYSQCSYPRVKLISRGNGDWLLSKIYKFKDKLVYISVLC